MILSSKAPVLIADLHELCTDVARMFLHDRFVPRLDAGTAGVAVMSDDSIASLERALTNPEARLPLTAVSYGREFMIHLGKIHMPEQTLTVVKNRYLKFLQKFNPSLCNRTTK